MKTNRKYQTAVLIFPALLLLLAITSCTERITVDVPESYVRLVVDGSITTDTMAHQVRLTKTSSYFSDQPVPVVHGATVYITDNTGKQYPLHETTKAGVYETNPDVYGVPGRKYSVHIRNVSVGTSNSWDSDPDSLATVKPVDSIGLKYHSDWGPAGVWEVKIYAQDPPTVDYYCFKVWKNDTLLTDSLKEYLYSDDELFNGNYTNGITGQILNNAKADEKVRLNDLITFELNSISEEYLYFIYDFLTEASGSDPMFSGPPANVRTNMNNGAIGYFSAYSVSKASARVKKL